MNTTTDTQIDEIEELGYFAARCELYAGEWGNTPQECRELEKRAEHYRMLQLAALAKL